VPLVTGRTFREVIIIYRPPYTSRMAEDIERLGGRIINVGRVVTYIHALIPSEKLGELSKLPWVISWSENIPYEAQRIEFFRGK